MSNYKLLIETIKRNKFQKYFVIAVTAVFTIFEVYTATSIIIDGVSIPLEVLLNFLFPLYFGSVLFMFFSYERFTKINSYKETFAVCKNNIISVQKTELSIFFFYILFLALEAILLCVATLIITAQLSFLLLFHVVTRLLCSYILCLSASVFIGLLLSNIRKRYIAYAVMAVFALSETGMRDTTSKDIFEFCGKDFSKFFEFFYIIPNSIDWSPNEQTGFVIDINKIALLLFFIVLSVWVMILVNNKSKKKIYKSVVCFILCFCLLFAYFIPVSYPKMDLSSSGNASDDLYYYYYEGCQKEEDADFKVKKYDLKFSAFLNLKADAQIYVDNKNLKEYKFTLYHNYKVSEVTDQNGNSLEFTQNHDYLTVKSNGETEYLNIKYYGGSAQYYSSYVGILLLSNFAYYPIPGFHETFYDYYGFIDNSLKYDTEFNVEFDYPKTVYCNLNEIGKNKFSGNAKSLTLISGFLETTKIDGTTIIYPYMSSEFTSKKIEKYFGGFIKDNKQIKNIFIIPRNNFTQYEGVRIYDDYLLTNTSFDIDQLAFEAKIDISKKDFYSYVSAYYDKNTDAQYLQELENDASDEMKKAIPLLKSLFSSKHREEAANDICEYLIDSNDNRSPLELLTELGEKYA